MLPIVLLAWLRTYTAHQTHTEAEIDNCLFIGITGSFYGLALACTGERAVVSCCLFTHCVSTGGSGGLVALNVRQCTVSKCSFIANYLANNYGAMYIPNEASCDINCITISDYDNGGLLFYMYYTHGTYRNFNASSCTLAVRTVLIFAFGADYASSARYVQIVDCASPAAIIFEVITSDNTVATIDSANVVNNTSGTHTSFGLLHSPGVTTATLSNVYIIGNTYSRFQSTNSIAVALSGCVLQAASSEILHIATDGTQFEYSGAFQASYNFDICDIATACFTSGITTYRAFDFVTMVLVVHLLS